MNNKLKSGGQGEFPLDFLTPNPQQYVQYSVPTVGAKQLLDAGLISWDNYARHMGFIRDAKTIHLSVLRS